MPHVNYLAVLGTAIVVFVLGWLWYSPFLFYKPLRRARGLDPAAPMAGPMPAGKLVIEFLRCIVLVYVIAHFVVLLGVSNWFIAAHFGLLLWIGFPVVLLAGSVLWENVPVKVAAIHAGDWLVKLLVIPIILSVWH
jgi:hypothetical protein